jgi:SAM-dependent methyltransferase
MSTPQPQEAPGAVLEFTPVDLGLRQDAVGHSLAVLASVEHYNRWIFNQFSRFIGQEVLEVGAGIGNITQFLLDRRRVVCLEPSPPFADYLRQRLAPCPSVQVLDRAIQDCPADDLLAGQFDTVLCLNVLEHIGDDVEALVRMRRMLKPGGRAIVLVPALPCIYGPIDQAMGHLRRYTLGSLKQAFDRAGLAVERGRYMNLAGVLGWWWYNRVLRKRRISGRAARLFNRMVPLLSALDRFNPLPIGQSVFLIGRHNS